MIGHTDSMTGKAPRHSSARQTRVVRATNGLDGVRHAPGRPLRSPAIGHVRTAHQGPAEHHLETDSETVVPVGVKLLPANIFGTRRFRRVGCKYWPMVARHRRATISRSSSCTSRSILQPRHEARFCHRRGRLLFGGSAVPATIVDNRPAGARADTDAAGFHVVIEHVRPASSTRLRRLGRRKSPA